MFDYNSLSTSRKLFIDAVRQDYPNLTDKITRHQIVSVCTNHKLNFPQWFTHPNNSASRGVFYLPKIDNDKNKKVVQDIIVEKTDNEIRKELEDKYQTLENVIKAVAEDRVNGIVISGAPGLSKSYTVTQVLNKSSNINYQFVSGYVKPTAVFKLLWENRFPNSILVFDDADSIFNELTSLNLLKKALEMSPKKNIQWLSEKVFASEEDGENIPKTFEYEGKIIFISNKDFYNDIDRGGAMAVHLSAIVSRSMYFDIGIKTIREYLIRIKMVIDTSNIITKYGLTKTAAQEISDYIFEHADKFRELSLRMVEKCATWYSVDKNTWQNMVKETCFRK